MDRRLLLTRAIKMVPVLTVLPSIAPPKTEPTPVIDTPPVLEPPVVTQPPKVADVFRDPVPQWAASATVFSWSSAPNMATPMPGLYSIYYGEYVRGR